MSASPETAAVEQALARGDGARALVLARRGLASNPSDPGLLTQLGEIYAASGRRAEARTAFEAALGADPVRARAWYGLAETLVLGGDDPAARHAYEQAVAAEPAHARAWAGLANLLARLGEDAAARTAAEQALALAPGDVPATVALAAAALGARDFEAAGEALGSIDRRGLEPTLRASVESLLGDVRHAQGRPVEAFAAWSEANAIYHGLYAPDFAANAQTQFEALERLEAEFEALPAAAWTHVAPLPAGPAAGHVFLLGFHRSGTTLLENALAAHPRVEALEEQPTLARAAAEFMAGDGGLARLAALDAAERMRWRDAYWQDVRGFGASPDGKLFIDKMPLQILQLPLIAALFPEARVLLTLRDPRDVVLSAFRQRFSPNAATFRMLRLQDTAGFYDRVMTFGGLYRGGLPLQLTETRYEALVEDFEGELRRIMAFIGLDWDPAVLAFAGHARSRAIATPSAAQVRRGVYKGGAGQWRAYREQLAPVLPLLDAWAARFGYFPD